MRWKSHGIRRASQWSRFESERPLCDDLETQVRAGFKHRVPVSVKLWVPPRERGSEAATKPCPGLEGWEARYAIVRCAPFSVFR